MKSVEWEVDETWTLFLDRDGVINKRIMGEYVTNLTEFHFNEKVLDSIGSLTAKFKYVFVVTNQQGVALGKMTDENLNEIHNYMVSEIQRVGGKITQVFSATELKNANSQMRKPSPKMAHMAKADFPEINFEKSIMVGDTDTDIQFGKKLGMKTVLILTEERVTEIADISVKSIYEFNNLLELKP